MSFGILPQTTDSSLELEDIAVLCPTLTDKAITTLAFVTLYENGERSFTFARKPEADLLLSTEDVKGQDIITPMSCPRKV